MRPDDVSRPDLILHMTARPDMAARFASTIVASA